MGRMVGDQNQQFLDFEPQTDDINPLPPNLPTVAQNLGFTRLEIGKEHSLRSCSFPYNPG
jgi:hypothetical protein